MHRNWELEILCWKWEFHCENANATPTPVTLILMAVWRSGNALVSINEVNLRSARLVLGWVTVSGFYFRRRHFISTCNQPPRSTQPSTLRVTVKWVTAKVRWCSAAGKVTAGLAESNGSLPPGGWLKSPAGLLRTLSDVSCLFGINIIILPVHSGISSGPNAR